MHVLQARLADHSTVRDDKLPQLGARPQDRPHSVVRDVAADDPEARELIAVYGEALDAEIVKARGVGEVEVLQVRPAMLREGREGRVAQLAVANGDALQRLNAMHALCGME